MRGVDGLKARVRAALLRRGYVVERLPPDELRYRTSFFDEGPTAAAPRADDPRLRELRDRYAALDWPVVSHSRWRREHVAGFLDVARFRGETLIMWHYRESRRISELKYFVWHTYLRGRVTPEWFELLREDGAFGCWTFEFPGHGRVSRDLLDSMNELWFLERHLGLSARDRLRVLDIGAGYGRLAHRMAAVAPGLRDYACTDAVPESTFVCEHYLRHRGVSPPARVVELPDVPSLAPGSFDVAVNVHSFSECTRAAVEWWADEIARLEVPFVFLVPNEPDGFLTVEDDWSRRDYGDVLTSRGYRIVADEHAFDDPAVRRLVDVHDRYYLLARG